MTLSPSASVMPRTPTELRPANTRTSVTGKRMHWPCAVVSSTSSRFGAGLDADEDRLALVELHGDLAVARRTSTKSESLLRRTLPPVGGEHHVERSHARLVLRQRHDGGDALALLRAAAG